MSLRFLSSDTIHTESYVLQGSREKDLKIMCIIENLLLSVSGPKTLRGCIFIVNENSCISLTLISPIYKWVLHSVSPFTYTV